jgi:hypothetical protein
MATSTKIAGNGQDDYTSGGTGVWSDPEHITADDSSWATAGSLGGKVTSHYLRANQFGFAIPTGATINGISATIMRKCSNNDMTNYAVDARVSIIKADGSIGSTNKYGSLTHWPTLEATASYGGTTDLWDETWTPDAINDSSFGIVLCIYTLASLPMVMASVDYITVTVTYTLDTSKFFLMW